MLEAIKNWFFSIIEAMAAKNCEAGKHCLHQYSNYKCCCWCRKVFHNE